MMAMMFMVCQLSAQLHESKHVLRQSKSILSMEQINGNVFLTCQIYRIIDRFQNRLDQTQKPVLAWLQGNNEGP